MLVLSTSLPDLLKLSTAPADTVAVLFIVIVGVVDEFVLAVTNVPVVMPVPETILPTSIVLVEVVVKAIVVDEG